MLGCRPHANVAMRCGPGVGSGAGLSTGLCAELSAVLCAELSAGVVGEVAVELGVVSRIGCPLTGVLWRGAVAPSVSCGRASRLPTAHRPLCGPF
ncbi:hypothetical protein CEP80_04975 [Jonesia denitrificans]|nr:hypothetical protein CEP80_04975 [Jonesia denitrificans]